VDARELGKYNVHVGLIEAYGPDTMTKVKAFKERVLRAKVDPARCDLILSTVNQAKGAEWSNVLVLDDLATLAAFNADADGLNRKRGHKPTKPAPFAEFQWKEYGDDFNLWYVACTRAKRRLAVPATYFDVEESFEEARRVATNEGVEEEVKAEEFVEVEEVRAPPEPWRSAQRPAVTSMTFIPPRQSAAKRREYTAEQVARIHALGVEKDRFLSRGL
jgi:superfamily I DNA/RNA helicase